MLERESELAALAKCDPRPGAPAPRGHRRARAAGRRARRPWPGSRTGCRARSRSSARSWPSAAPARRTRRPPPPAHRRAGDARPPSSEAIARELERVDRARASSPGRADRRRGAQRRAPGGFRPRPGRARGRQEPRARPCAPRAPAGAAAWSCSTSGWSRTTARRRASAPRSSAASGRSRSGARTPTSSRRAGTRARSRHRQGRGRAAERPGAAGRRRGGSARASSSGSTSGARRSAASTSGSPRPASSATRCAPRSRSYRVAHAGLRQDAEHLAVTFQRALRAAAAAEERRASRRADLAEHEAELARCKAALERLGPVNVLAVQEHDEQEERLKFLTDAARRRGHLGREPAQDHQGDQRDLGRALPRHLRGGQRRTSARPSRASSAAARPRCACSTRRTCWRAASRSSPARRASGCRT